MEACLKDSKEKKIPLEFFTRNDVAQISRDLLGCTLISEVGGVKTGGTIVETEAYRGPDDRACHAYQNKRTERTEVMFHQGGVCYVYLCYGMHHLLNVVTGEENHPHAVLIRAITPLFGIETMLKRRKKSKVDTTLLNGPGKVTQALGIDRTLNGTSLLGPKVWIERGPKPKKILATPRIGVEYAKEDAKRPWRFMINLSEISKR